MIATHVAKFAEVDLKDFDRGGGEARRVVMRDRFGKGLRHEFKGVSRAQEMKVNPGVPWHTRRLAPLDQRLRPLRQLLRQDSLQNGSSLGQSDSELGNLGL